MKVHYLLRKDRYWSNVLSEAESHRVEEGLRRQGIVLHFFSEVSEISGRGGRVVAVKTTNGEVIPCDMVAMAIGVLPRKGLAEAAGLQCGRGVLVGRASVVERAGYLRGRGCGGGPRPREREEDHRSAVEFGSGRGTDGGSQHVRGSGRDVSQRRPSERHPVGGTENHYHGGGSAAEGIPTWKALRAATARRGAGAERRRSSRLPWTMLGCAWSWMPGVSSARWSWGISDCPSSGWWICRCSVIAMTPSV